MKFGAQAPSQVTPQEKLQRMAQQLAAHQLDAYYVSPEDEHLNEYLPENKKRIEWLTGFSGESAPLLVTPSKMHVYVDGRFHLQVDDEVDAAVVYAHKLDPTASGDAQVVETLKTQAKKNDVQQPFRVGYDPFAISPNRLKYIQQRAAKLPVAWVAVPGNLIDPTWTERPASAAMKAFAVEESITGRSVADKLKHVREDMATHGVDVLPVTRLDDVGWLFNIRGGDIPFNPVLEAYAIVTPDHAYLFAPPQKIPADLKQRLNKQGVIVLPYEDYPGKLQALASASANGKKSAVLIDKGSVTMGTWDLVAPHATVIERDNPITLEKARKNPTEIERMRLANFRASRAIIRHLAAMDQAFAQGERLSEVDVRADLEAKYKEEPEFFDLSFPTIPGIGTNSAIIHYSKADPKQVGKAGDFYLLDSGCQYLGGTTDTTRTTVFGKPAQDKIDKFTAVLKAHIACASLRFPQGTTGQQIDAVCRSPMWNQGLDFAHGTGHGVGAFLNVHEGPNRISKAGMVKFEPGMVTSIEPGYYEAGWGGIRLENLYYVTEDTHASAFQGVKWLRFEPLTFVPFEKKLINFKALTPQEQDWLKAHYRQIWNNVGPTLSADEKAWLKDQLALPTGQKAAAKKRS